MALGSRPTGARFDSQCVRSWALAILSSGETLTNSNAEALRNRLERPPHWAALRARSSGGWRDVMYTPENSSSILTPFWIHNTNATASPASNSRNSISSATPLLIIWPSSAALCQLVSSSGPLPPDKPPAGPEMAAPSPSRVPPRIPPKPPRLPEGIPQIRPSTLPGDHGFPCGDWRVPHWSP